MEATQTSEDALEYDAKLLDGDSTNAACKPVCSSVRRVLILSGMRDSRLDYRYFISMVLRDASTFRL